MSASALANKIQYQDAFANKKLQQQQKPHYEGTGALNSHPSEHKFSDNITKGRLEDPFVHDSGYLSNATFNKKSEENEDALDDQSIYSTPLGKSQQQVEAADTPLPASTPQNPAKSGDAPSKESDDYDKVVQVIHDHIAKELPKMPEPESKPVEGQKQECCCGHKAAEAAAEKPAAADEEKGTAEQESAEETAVAGESEGCGKEEKDEGDDTVIVTLKATQPADDVLEKKEEILKSEAAEKEDEATKSDAVEEK